MVGELWYGWYVVAGVLNAVRIAFSPRLVFPVVISFASVGSSLLPPQLLWFSVGDLSVTGVPHG